MKVREGELEFDFTSAKSVDKLDNPSKQRPEGMHWWISSWRKTTD